MRAWEIRNGKLDLHEVAPVQAAEGEAIVRIKHIGICGSDLPKLVRPQVFALPEPWRPGHEIVGTDPTGRVVAIDPLISCGTCNACAAGDSHLCPGLRRLGWDLPGGFAEQIVVPAANAHPLPNGVDPLHAVLADPAAVAIHGLRCTPISPPGRLAVIGAGTVGLLTALYANQHGWQVTVIHRDGRPPPRAIVDAVPATFQPPRLPENSGFDVVVDAASGAHSTPLELALHLVRESGTVVVQNAYQPNVVLPLPLRDIFRRSIRLIGSFSYCRRSLGDFEMGLKLLDQCSDAVGLLVTQVGGLADLGAVLERPRPRAGRQVLTVKVI